MTYDIPVKLFAFHLIVLSLFLVAPQSPPAPRGSRAGPRKVASDDSRLSPAFGAPFVSSSRCRLPSAST